MEDIPRGEDTPADYSETESLGHAETISVRGMSSAVKQRFEDQLLPPIDPELRAEWKTLRKQRQHNAD